MSTTTTDAPAWTFAELVPALVTELGPGWTDEPERHTSDHYRYITNGTVRLSLSQTTWPPKERAKVSISGSYPHRPGCPYRSPRDYGLTDGAAPEIGVNVARGAATIAKEIRRRLLPEVERITAGMVARHEQEQAHADLTQRHAEQLAAALGGRIAEHGDSEGFTRMVYGPGGIYARVCGDSVTWDRLSTPVALALELAPLMVAALTREGSDDA